MAFKVILFLDRSDVVETFEALCSLPPIPTSITDNEPNTKREKGIEDLIEQLESTYRSIVE